MCAKGLTALSRSSHTTRPLLAHARRERSSAMPGEPSRRSKDRMTGGGSSSGARSTRQAFVRFAVAFRTGAKAVYAYLGEPVIRLELLDAVTCPASPARRSTSSAQRPELSMPSATLQRCSATFIAMSSSSSRRRTCLGRSCAPTIDVHAGWPVLRPCRPGAFTRHTGGTHNQPLLWTGPRRGCMLFYYSARTHASRCRPQSVVRYAACR